MDASSSEKPQSVYSQAERAVLPSSTSSAKEKADLDTPVIDSSSPVADDDVPADPFDSYPEGGRGWIVVLGCVIFSASTAWGIVQTYYVEHLFPHTSESVLSTLGSMSGMIMTLTSVITGKLGDRYGYKPFLAAGALCWTVSMLCSAFCTKVWQFFLTQGVLQGIACSLVFPLIVALPAQWFYKYRALTTGIVVAGSSLGGAVASMLMYGMLESLGLRRTFAIYSAIDAVSMTAAFFMIQERRRPQSKRPDIIWFDRTFFMDPVFWSLGLCFLFTTFGYLSPIFYLPTYTSEKIPSASLLLSSLPVTALNLSAAAGRTLIGFVADRTGPVNALFVAIFMSGITQILIWNFVTTYAGIMIFAILYGFFCGCFISLSPAVGAQLYGSGRLAGLSGLLLFFNLPGNSAGAPLGGAILSATNGSWRAVASWSGAMQIVGAIILLYARFKRQPKLFSVY
ncbi:major facilitator superfamily domain-containing protein [Sparassis latifolia]